MTTPEATPRAFAALITIDFEGQNVMWTIYDDATRDGDPIQSAKQLAESVRADWPNHEQHVIGNAAARDIHGKRRVAAWLGDAALDEESQP